MYIALSVLILISIFIGTMAVWMNSRKKEKAVLQTVKNASETVHDSIKIRRTAPKSFLVLH
jgi:uncharacterized Tic20 family protein